MSTLSEAFVKQPPHSLDAEMNLLGSLIVCEPGKRKIFSTVRALIDRECFYQSDHQIYFDVLNALYDRGAEIDAAIVKEELIRRQVFEECGGQDYLVKLVMKVPSYQHAAQYAKVIKEKSLLRSLISISNDALRDAYAAAADDVAQQYLLDLAAKASKLAAGGSSNEVHKIGDVVMEVLNRPRGGDALRIPTGFFELDDIIGGLRVGGKTIVGGRPGMGKSAFIKQILYLLAKGAAGRPPIPVGLITIEEGRGKVGENILSNASGVINNRIAFGTASEQEWNELVNAAVGMDPLQFYIVDSARKLSSIIGMANVLACQYGCKVIGVDHLHIIDGQCDERREREISKISAELKWAWKDLGVAGIEAAQLNRGSGCEPPTLASLRDSGSLEQDGDLVMLLHRRDYYGKSEPGYQPTNIIEIIIDKNKDGATATVPLAFNEARQRIENMAIQDPFAK